MKKVLYEYILRNKKNYIILSILFLIGIVLGIIIINNLSNDIKTEINEYLDNVVSNIKGQNQINKFDMLILSIKDNVSYILLIWFLGCTIVGGCLIYLAIIYKGFDIGYTCAALVASIESKVGIMLILSTFVLQNMILIPGIFLIAENGIKLYKGICKKCTYLKEEVIRHSIIMLISIMIVIISSLIEVYVSVNLLIFLKEFL